MATNTFRTFVVLALLVLLLAVLKIGHAIAWPWVVIFAPLWITYGVALAWILGAGIGALLERLWLRAGLGERLP